MISNTVFIKTYSSPEFNIKEALRYAGCKGKEDEFIPAITELYKECKQNLSYRVCYGIFPVTATDSGVDFHFSAENSTLLAKRLSGCNSALVFGATIGIEIDRLIAKYGRISPSKALFFQAIGAERIESLCNMFCADMQDTLKNEGLFLLPRLSPGYGDFSLDFQKDIFRALDCNRRIGLSLNESMLMSPSKSVTAIAGISDKACDSADKKCSSCNKIDCCFRSN